MPPFVGWIIYIYVLLVVTESSILQYQRAKRGSAWPWFSHMWHILFQRKMNQRTDKPRSKVPWPKYADRLLISRAQKRTGHLFAVNCKSELPPEAGNTFLRSLQSAQQCWLTTNLLYCPNIAAWVGYSDAGNALQSNVLLYSDYFFFPNNE